MTPQSPAHAGALAYRKAVHLGDEAALLSAADSIRAALPDTGEAVVASLAAEAGLVRAQRALATAGQPQDIQLNDALLLLRRSIRVAVGAP